MPTANRQSIEDAARRLAPLDNVCCLTGAGVSAESGVPTFRGPGGFWQGQRAEDLATPQAFQRDPRRVWAFYNYRRELLRSCQPNAAHVALCEMENVFRCFTLITQNIDGLHQAAGSRTAIELHGNIWTVRCIGCGQETSAAGETLGDLPTCGRCAQLLRPAIVWFGETLPAAALAAAEAGIECCQAMLVAGTSATVQPAASMAYWAKSNGAILIEVNLEPTPLSEVADVALHGPAGEVLPALHDCLQILRRQDEPH